MNWIEGETGMSFLKIEPTVKPRPPFKQAHGEDWHREAGRIGGTITSQRYGPEFFSAIAKAGAIKRASLKPTP